MGIGKRIKEARENLGITQNELGELVGVTGSAITNYEKETSHPKESIMYKLLETLKVDANYLFQDVVSINYEFKANYKEQALVKKYRSLDSFGQETVNIALDRESKRVTAISDMQKQLDVQSDQIINAEEASDKLYLYTYLRKIACAGTGFYFDDIPTTMIEAPYMNGADFIIGVNGDSMEPTYHDGDKLYVQKVSALTLGDEGVFTVWGECFVKELGERGLISRNPVYDDISGTEDVRLVGRVLGKVEN